MSLTRLHVRSVTASAIEYASVTEQVALGVARLEGAGAPEKAYTLATEIFQEELHKVDVSGQVAILREERLDEKGQEGAISAVSAAPRGMMLRTPDMYMSKLIVGPHARGSIDIDAPVAENISAIAEANGRRPSEITVAVLDRERHEGLIEEIRKTGARIQIRPEGDLTPAIAVGLRGSELHAVIGIGGAPEGILAAAVIKCLGGEIQAKMWPTQRSQ